MRASPFGTVLLTLMAGGAAVAEAQIAGVPVSCIDSNGTPVALLGVPNLNDIGKSSVMNNQPVILMNSSLLPQQAPVMQLFWYAHECGHHVLGHVMGGVPVNEAAADCWAVRTGRNQAWFPPQAFQLLVQALGNSPGSVWGHLPGPDRIKNMWVCYSQP